MEAHGVHYAEAMLYRERIQLKAVHGVLWGLILALVAVLVAQ